MQDKLVSIIMNCHNGEKFLSQVITSGEAAMHAINQNKFGKFFFHLGPPRDTSVFEKVKDSKTEINNCDFILCTGLFDEHEENMEYYKAALYILRKVSVIFNRILSLIY